MLGKDELSILEFIARRRSVIRQYTELSNVLSQNAAHPVAATRVWPDMVIMIRKGRLAGRQTLTDQPIDLGA
jgi:hypothetical protein